MYAIFLFNVKKGIQLLKKSGREFYNDIKRSLNLRVLISYLKKIIKKFNDKRHIELIRYSVKDNEYYKQNEINQKSLGKKNEDPKIVCVFLTWNNLEFFKFSIQQALEFCDEVLLVEGSHFKKYPKRSTDGTVEYIKEIIGHPKLRVFHFNFEGRNDVVQLKIRVSILKYAKYATPGNWIIQWDDDNFFFEDDLIRLKKLIKTTKYDTIVFKERRFIYNFRFSTFTNKKGLLHRGGGQIDRIREGTYFKGRLNYQTHPRLYYKNGLKYNNILYMDDLITFHYPYVRTPERVKARWEISVEKGIIKNKNNYNKFMSVKWKEDNDVFKFKHIIEELMQENCFNIYNKNHPKILEHHLWRYVNDARDQQKKND